MIHHCILGNEGVIKDIFLPWAFIIPARIVIKRELRLAIHKATHPRNKIKNSVTVYNNSKRTGQKRSYGQTRRVARPVKCL